MIPGGLTIASGSAKGGCKAQAGVRPDFRRGKSRLTQIGLDILAPPFARMFRQNSLAHRKSALAAAPAHDLVAPSFEVHFYARPLRVVEGDVTPERGIEIGAGDAVRVPQDVEIERGCNAGGVIISRFQRLSVLDEVGAGRRSPLRRPEDNIPAGA